MKKSYLTSILLAILLFFASCAKQSSPTGGPRDEQPPRLIDSQPKSQTLNTSPKEIKLIFDEFVGLENASKGIVITPRLDKDKIEFTSLKNTIAVKINQQLEDNTTYVFDFQKSVIDISEKNPAENLKIIFSTGNSIDSLILEGKTNFYFPEQSEDYKNVLIGLYPINDTTDVFKDQPYYLGQIDTLGNFKITNIKNGIYKGYAWRDSNGNLKADFKTEEYDFLPDSIILDKDQKNLSFNLSKADLTPIRILRSSTFGSNYDIAVNRDPLITKIENQEIGKSYFYKNLEKKIRIYTKNIQTDSIPFKIHLIDSVGFTKDTLIYAKFLKSERKPEKLETEIKAGKNFHKDLQIDLKFNKPILEIKLDSLEITYDSASKIPIQKEMLTFIDSTRRDHLIIRLTIPDSIDKEIFTLRAADSTFIDIEGQPNEKEVKGNFKKLKREELADEIRGKIINADPPYIIQLLDNKGDIIAEQFEPSQNEYSFKLIEPGTFKIRVIEDKNGNKLWDPSNYIQKRLAERVFYFKGEENKGEVIVRSGWTMEDQNVEANDPTGIKNIQN